MRIQLFVLFSIVLFASSCGETITSQETHISGNPENEDTLKLSTVEEHYLKYKDRTGESRSKGTVSNGSLENGYLFPFSGSNFHYFDTTSYLNNRAFVNGRVLKATLQAYEILETQLPGRNFGIMECSNERGGEISPHRTHRNGLSVDFMTPLLRNNTPYTDLDFAGAVHYLMDFENNGQYKEDASVTIDFETVAHHLLVLNDAASKNGLKITKVIWKTELRDELFASPSGKKLLATGIYITTNLTPLINTLHDDHYHVDFELR